MGNVKFEAGQVWRDMDPRQKGERTVTLLARIGTRSIGVKPDKDGVWQAVASTGAKVKLAEHTLAKRYKLVEPAVEVGG